jgi:hypothetical protein
MKESASSIIAITAICRNVLQIGHAPSPKSSNNAAAMPGVSALAAATSSGQSLASVRLSRREWLETRESDAGTARLLDRPSRFLRLPSASTRHPRKFFPTGPGTTPPGGCATKHRKPRYIHPRPCGRRRSTPHIQDFFPRRDAAVLRLTAEHSISDQQWLSSSPLSFDFPRTCLPPARDQAVNATAAGMAAAQPSTSLKARGKEHQPLMRIGAAECPHEASQPGAIKRLPTQKKIQPAGNPRAAEICPGSGLSLRRRTRRRTAGGNPRSSPGSGSFPGPRRPRRWRRPCQARLPRQRT